MKPFASVRFAHVLAPRERAAVTRTVRSAGATPTSWNAVAARSYALLELDDPSRAMSLASALAGATVTMPPLVVLRVVPDVARGVAALFAALAGPGRPAGVVQCDDEGDALIVEIDSDRTPLSTIVALIDVELSRGTRRIEPVLPLSDASLAAFAGALLGEPDIDASRLIETHLEPLLATRP